MRTALRGMLSGRRRAGVVLALAGASALAVPAAASAEDVYVAPDGNAFFCSETQPCGIGIGINLAGDDTVVLVAPGTYSLTNPLEVPAASQNVIIRPQDPSATRPVIESTANIALQIAGGNATVQGIEIRHDNPGSPGLFALAGGTRIKNVVSTSNGDTACQVVNTRLTDTICHATATGGRALRMSLSGGNATAIIRNATLIADGSNGPGIYATASGTASVSLDVRSSIIRGEGPADIETEASVASPVTVTLAASSFASAVQDVGATVTVPGTVGNQTAAPLFTGPTFEQAAGSPTVNAGSVDAETGTADVYGDARPQGAANDIGADEFPEAVPPPPADITSPETTITKAPKKKSKKRMATFAFAASEPGSTFECKVDRGTFAPCGSSLALKKLKRKGHNLAVRAIDPAGNVDATPATHKWKVKKKQR